MKHYLLLALLVVQCVFLQGQVDKAPAYPLITHDPLPSASQICNLTFMSPLLNNDPATLVRPVL